MAYQAIPPATSASSPAELALARARRLLGNTVNTVMGTDFDTASWHTTSIAGTGVVAISTTAKMGVITLTTGATNGGLAAIGPIRSAGALTSQVSNPKNDVWYVTARAAITSAGDAVARQSLNLFGVAMGNPQIYFGLIGTVSQTLLSYNILSNAGAAVASGSIASVTLDTNYHTFEMWCDATNLSFAYDGVTVATVATSTAGFPTNPCAPGATVFNSTTNAARTMELDQLFLCGVRN